MNPNKVVNAYLPTENLRLGADYKPNDPETHFQFPDDDGSFAKATLRCIGLGECRKHDSGTMCPSYMVTLEEEHSTRGRAHMLFEVLQGEVVRDGWKDEQRQEGARPVPLVQGVQVGMSRRTWTWPRTNRNSCPTITRGRAARCMRTRSA